ncbi:MAG TPA: HDOD domain-containing protein [Candidatus Tenderia electrophaga]|uniref:HDOD domain-containing protein n=1 Tax=Candidatus Tenderia electrophaga TaxID=1748243 RepID=A0A832J7Z3_9GAMM|nr:HDOD domain-containing protein [Candidatus Tenderia electrophaga]
MAIAKTIKQYLDSRHIVYSVIEVSRFESPLEAAIIAKIPPRSLYYPVVMRDAFGLMMAVVPASHKIDFDGLSELLHRKVSPAYQTQLSSVFADCQPGHIPPVGIAYGLRTVIDAALTTPDEVYIVAGDHSRLIKMSRKNFMMLQTNALLASDFAQLVDGVKEAGDESANLSWDSDLKAKLRQRVEQATELPPMPEMATRVFQLRADPHAEIADLVSLIEQDPSLSAQVIRYANSPYFNFRGGVDNLHDAISRVLGFDMVMNLAMGLALAKPFKIPRPGPLGLDHYWQHAVYSASLMQMLCKEIPQEKRPRAGTSYLIGLLHDFGYLVLGHLFREEFDGLNKLLAEQGLENRAQIEKDYLGVTHGELGSWLLEAWNLPDELVESTREHHNQNYSGASSIYVNMARLTDQLLEMYETGEVLDDELPQALLDELGLESQQVIKVMTQLFEHGTNLNDMVRLLAA